MSVQLKGLLKTPLEHHGSEWYRGVWGEGGGGAREALNWPSIMLRGVNLSDSCKVIFFSLIESEGGGF